MKRIVKTLLSAALATTALAAQAHTGHGTSSLMEGLAHPFGLDHLLAMVAVGVWSVSALPAGKADKFMEHTWQGRRWSWVDPLKDVKASVEAIHNNLASPQQIAAQTGRDLVDVLDDIQRYHDMLRDRGLPIPTATGAAPAAATAAEAEDEEWDDDWDEDDEEGVEFIYKR